MYKYGMRLRGYAPLCQPMDGLVNREDDPTGKYHDILVYDRKLTEFEMKYYDLDYLCGLERPKEIYLEERPKVVEPAYDPFLWEDDEW